MASKKRDGSGSNLGLIITLVFFVLTTVLLGVTTYLAYSDNEAKDKAKKTAEVDKKKAEDEMRWHRFKADLLRDFMGHPSAREEAKDVPRLKKDLDADSSTFKSMADYADVRAFVTGNLNKAMPWDAAAAEKPSTTYEKRLEDKDKDITSLRAEVAAANRRVQEEKLRADAARKDADDSSKTFAAKLKEQADTDKAERAKLAAQITALQADLARENDAKNLVSKGEAAVRGEIDKIKKERDKFASDLVTARKEKSDVQVAFEEVSSELRIMKDKTGIDPADLEAKRLDAAALAELRNWDVSRKPWKLTEMDRTGRMPYINLGSADKLQPQVTFSIHSLGRDGKLNPVPKGTLEVIAIKGPRLAQARITSLAKGNEKDPILKGDYLFNPTWDPHSRKRIVLAGLADLNEDRTDSTKVLLDLLARQGVDVVGSVDASSDKELPRLVGDGVTTKTDYMVLGDTLEEVNHHRARDREFAEAYRRIIRDQQEKARANSIPVITLRKYLDMIGYRAPKLSSSGRGLR